MPTLVVRWTVLASLVWLAGCAPAAPPAPTAAPASAKPAATAAQPKPTEAPKPAATAAPAAKPAEAKPAASPAAAAKPTEVAKPAAVASPATKLAAFDEKAVADFYRGKTVRIQVGFGAGGPFDVYARLAAKYLPKYLPGSPTIIVENKPGASGIVAANGVYNTEPKDGTVILVTNEYNMLLQVVGADGIQYEAAKFNWLGASVKSAYICVGRGVGGLQEMIDGKQLIIGTTGPGTPTNDVPALLNATLGTKLKLVSGYADFAKIKLAIEGGEVDGACGGWDGVVLSLGELMSGDKPVLKAFVSLAPLTGEAAAHPLLKGVQAAETLAKTDDAKELIRALNVPAQINKPYAAAPGVPQDRVQALRRGLAQSYADPQFLADAQQSKLFVGFSNGEEVQRIIESVVGLPASTRDKLKAILK